MRRAGRRSLNKIPYFSAAVGRVHEPVHATAFLVAALAGKRDIVSIVAAALRSAPQVLYRFGIRWLLARWLVA
jgi:hypothetical protein